jgi:hypothetical protein
VSLIVPVEDVKPWILIDQSFSTIFPAGMQPDRSLVKKVRDEFDPYFVPLFMVREYKPPYGSKMKIEYFVIGRWSSEPEEAREPLRVQRGPDFPWSGGYIYDQRTWSYAWPAGTDGARRNIPDIPRRFDSRTVEWMREAHYSLLRSDESLRAQWLRRQEALEYAELRYLTDAENEAKKRLHSDSRVTKAIEEGLDKPAKPDNVDESHPHVQAEKVMEGTKLVKEMGDE